MKRWLFYASLLVVCALAYWFAAEHTKTRDARLDATRSLSQCVDKTIQSQKSPEANIGRFSVEVECKDQIADFRIKACDKNSNCEDQIRQRLGKNIAEAQKRKLTKDRVKQLEKQRADEIRIVADKLGMNEDQLFRWILKNFKEELLDALDDEFRLRYTPDEGPPADDGY